MQTPTLRCFLYFRSALVSAMCHRRNVRSASVCSETILAVSQEEVLKPVCGDDREPGQRPGRDDRLNKLRIVGHSSSFCRALDAYSKGNEFKSHKF